MKKIILMIVLTAIFSILSGKAEASNVSHTSAQLAPIESQKDYSQDLRTKAVRNVFNKYNSPLVDEAAHYVRYADEYNVDWKLLPAISGLESTFAKHFMPGSYNAYGWGGGYIYFDSWEDGIKTINAALAKNYLARGATDVWSIGPIYAESPTWAVRVNIFMKEIEREYQRLSLFASI